MILSRAILWLNSAIGIALAGFAVGSTITFQFFSTTDVVNQLNDLAINQESIQEANNEIRAISETITHEEIQRVVVDVISSQNSPETAQQIMSEVLDNALLQKINNLESSIADLKRGDAKATLALKDEGVQNALEKLENLDTGDVDLLESITTRIDQLEATMKAIEDAGQLVIEPEVIESAPVSTPLDTETLEKVANLNDKKLQDTIQSVESAERLFEKFDNLEQLAELANRVNFLEDVLANVQDDVTDLDTESLTIIQVQNALDVLSTSNLKEGYNLYFTDDRARKAASPLLPVGSVYCWHKNFAGTPPLTEYWHEVDGSTITDTNSPYNGATLPDWNGEGRFLRGGTESGIEQDDEFGRHQHNGDGTQEGIISDGTAGLLRKDGGGTPDGIDSGGSEVNVNNPMYIPAEGGDETRPINASCVWIMRIK